MDESIEKIAVNDLTEQINFDIDTLMDKVYRLEFLLARLATGERAWAVREDFMKARDTYGNPPTC